MARAKMLGTRRLVVLARAAGIVQQRRAQSVLFDVVAVMAIVA